MLIIGARLAHLSASIQYDPNDDVDVFLRALANWLPDIPKNPDRKPATRAELDQVGKDLLEALKGHTIHIFRK